MKRLVPCGNLWKMHRMQNLNELEDRKAIERQLNSLARQYHNQALETKSVADFNTALELYETYVESFPNEANSYEMGFYYAELLLNRKWEILGKL